MLSNYIGKRSFGLFFSLGTPAWQPLYKFHFDGWPSTDFDELCRLLPRSGDGFKACQRVPVIVTQLDRDEGSRDRKLRDLLGASRFDRGLGTAQDNQFLRIAVCHRGQGPGGAKADFRLRVEG
jgi:hypothetical protein